MRFEVMALSSTPSFQTFPALGIIPTVRKWHCSTTTTMIVQRHAGPTLFRAHIPDCVMAQAILFFCLDELFVPLCCPLRTRMHAGGSAPPPP